MIKVNSITLDVKMNFTKIFKHRILENIIWYAYLFSFVIISFITQKYDSVGWLYFSSVFYLLCAVYVITLIFGARCHWLAINNSKVVIICTLLTILWLWLQTIIEVEKSSLFSQLENSPIPEWFHPVYKLSLMPEKTSWLMFSNIFVFTWFLMSLALIDSRQRLKQLLKVFLFIGIFHACAGMMAMYSDIYFIDIKQLDGHYTAARGWFVNRNHFASFLVFALLGSMVTLFNNILKSNNKLESRVMFNKDLLNKAIYLLGAILIISAIILSQSRAGFVGFVITFTVVTILFYRFKQRVLIFNRNYFLFFMLILVVLVINFGGELVSRITGEELFLGERISQWMITWQAIKISPVMGYGGGSYAIVFQYFREFIDLRQVLFNQSHNDYLQIWLEQGLIGLTLWFTILIIVFKRSILLITKNRSSLIISISLSALVIMITTLLQAGVDFNLQIINIRCLFFTILALILVAPTIKHKSVL